MEFVEERVDITALLQGILNAYPGNSAILREYVQNSDDARAKKQVFVLDERTYPTDSLCDESLCGAQGPALFAFNDGVLSEKDWDALTTIHSSSKKADETQTGKNGLGFRASYHLTETPHVLSDGTLMILDPHRRLQRRNAGLKISIEEAGREYPDQLKPFEGVREVFASSEDIASMHFQGTIFRLPLRTDIQAQQSRIKSSSSSVEEVRSLLFDFSQAELCEVVLFLKHITQIEVHHIDASGNRILFGKISIERLSPSPSFESLQSVYIRRTTYEKADGTVEERRWYFRSLDVDNKEAGRVISERLGYPVGNSLTADKLFPSIELATPEDGGPIMGSLFTLLPLPIKTYFPVHLNAVFALTPDRQSLKNIEEVGNVQSRERRLVEWNRAIFEVWAPVAWADLIEQSSSSRQPWSIWPPEETSAYWQNLTTNLVREVVRRHLPVFATIQRDSEAPSFISLRDTNTLIAPPSVTVDLLILAELGMNIVQPPQHIFSILTSDDVSVELSPSTLHVVLTHGYQRGTWQPYNRHTIGGIIDYLVFSTSSPSLSNLVGLPWFECSNGTTVTLHSPGFLRGTYIIPESEEDARLFAKLPCMLAWSCLPEKLRIALLQNKSNELNVAPLRADDIIHVLTSQFTSCDFGSEDSDVAWVLDFLSWLDRHQDLQRQLFNRNTTLPSLFLLPTTAGLRRLSGKAIFTNDISVANVWETLGVPRLRNNLSNHVVALLSSHNFIEAPDSPGFLPFVLDNSEPALTRLSMNDFEALRRSIYSVVVHQPFLPPLTQSQKRVLEQLSVFSVRQTMGGTAFSSIRGDRLHVTVGNDFPLPLQDSPTIYVDVQDPETNAFIRLIERLDEKGIWDLLRIAVAHWSDQPVDLQDKFIEHIFKHWSDLPPSILERLAKLPFVSVNGTDSRVPPTNLIHPHSDITPLYEGEVGRVPSGRFAKRRYVTIMQGLGFIHHALDSKIVEERLSYLSKNSVNDVKAFEKSVAFVRLLSRFWDPRFSEHIQSYRDSPWMPGTMPSNLVTPRRSRDLYVGSHSDPRFYDFELNIFGKDVVSVSEPQFRQALGWSDPVPCHVLVEQFRKTILRPHDEDRYLRLKILIKYMNQRLRIEDFSLEVMKSACEVVPNVPWIPVLASSTETVGTEYALLSPVDLQPPFRQVHFAECRPFLLAMGCMERPTLDSMTRELGKYEYFEESNILAMLALLKEISTYGPIVDPHCILVPTQKGQAYPADNVYYPDADFLLPPSLQNKFATHSCISRALSDRLGIRTLTSFVLDLDEDRFDEDDQMGVDLIDRIRGFLQEYDIQYALNEFLANADDAGAKEFSVMLDCRRLSFPRTGIISPAFHELHHHASLILYNNSTFTANDFEGLRKVGRGGKVDNEDTHGRHGLGALSFYYFTDVATVISGEHVLILDPSGSYLPRTRHGGKRTALLRRLSDICSQYPNHLRPYDKLYGFSQDGGFYNGTLFCLPLKTQISAERCDEERVRHLLDSSYRNLAESAFFFTRLSEIRAEVLSDASHKTALIWSLFATRTESSRLNEKFSYHFLETGGQNREREEWIIPTSAGNQIPTVHEATATGLKLTQSNLTVQLAIKLKPTKGPKAPSALFSTLRLPRTTSFPFHLNARFAISSNRQSIVFDSPDSQNARDPKTNFNAWILTDVVPPLYLDTLPLLIQKHVVGHILPKRSSWLLKVDGEDMYKHTAEAFHSLLVESDNPLFKSTDGSLLSFKNSIFSKGHGHAKEVVEALISFVARDLVVDYSSSGITTLGKARTIDPAYVKGILRDTPLETIQYLYSKGTINLNHMLQLLEYISNEGYLVGFPILALSTNTPICIPSKMDRCVYLSQDRAHAELFNLVPFLDTAFARSSFDQIWSSDDINVIKLTINDVKQLIRDQLDHSCASEKEEWLKKFWRNYASLPGPPPLSALNQLNLKLVRGSLQQYSLGECRSHRVVYLQSSDLRQMLSPALLGLGIDVIQPISNSTLLSYLNETFPPSLVNILNCLAHKNICDFDSLPAEEGDKLANWFESSIKSYIGAWLYSDRGLDRGHLFRLKIWPAHTSRGKDLHSASDLGLLPRFMDISVLTPYLQHRPIASYSSTLNDVILFCRFPHPKKKKKNPPIVTMSPEGILASIQIPSSINDLSELEGYKDFLHCFFEFGSARLATISVGVYDTSGRIRPLNQLYDHNVPLFLTTLASSSADFVHPGLRDVGLQVMRDLGLKFEVSFDTFYTCVMAVQNSLQSHNVFGRPTLDELMDMSREAFRCYNDGLPSLLMSNRRQWARLDDIKFVRPKNTRRQGASYIADDHYMGEQGLLLAPKHFVLPELEPVAWTQRALFFDEPSDNLVALNTKLGVPEVCEVVSHLRVLTTQIAPNHPGNSTLLSDIKATYKWLNDHAEQAREHMVLLEGERLFLNVDDPYEDRWIDNWVMAQELVLYLHYDYGNMKRVKTFLQEYSALLRASGCSTMSLFSRDRMEQAATDLSTKQTDMTKVFDEMRKGGEIVDMMLLPIFDSPIDVLGLGAEQGEQEVEVEIPNTISDLADSSLEEGTKGETSDIPDAFYAELRAHRVVLAAAIPYIRDSLGGGWKHDKHGELVVVPFNGTFFGAKCSLDFIYTGDFDYVTPPADSFDDMKSLLYELLSLLPIADEWEIPGVRARVEWHIIHKHDLVQRLLPLHEDILKIAERYEAKELKNVVNELIEGNQQLMRKLKEATK